ncbi:GNAT family N-acetyltransferase [Gryllotalpicola daejeonensis]|uniref:GNAT family N-acetyltransferase n=1 Tax=Gryllotalpicola daejeonensis TaxID=993087 RepID=A0ABP7ZF15_9MICO
MREIRAYAPADEQAWLRCRLLSFFNTSYFDDVWTARPMSDDLAVALVAVQDDALIGLIDVTVEASAATIDSIAVLPDASRRGIGTGLLDAALAALPPGIATVDAWTRDDVAANAWYQRNGFVENYRYLHVYKGHAEPGDGFVAPAGISSLETAFMHAPREREAELRARFERVHVCRQYLRHL